MPAEYNPTPDHTRLHYEKVGTGTKVLLLFHGFGQDHHVFDEWSREVSHHYTLYLFDAFFHGKSEWTRGEEPLEKGSWRSLIESTLVENQISKFGLLGFSMGAKFALATLEAFPSRVQSMILIAPDGIRLSPWYNAACSTTLGRKIFRSLVHDHNRFLAVAHVVRRLRLVDQRVLRFAEGQMNTAEKRAQVYLSWVVLRRLRVDVKKIADVISTHSIDFRLCIGKNDQVITEARVKSLVSLLKRPRVVVLDAGHHDLLRLALSRLTSELSTRNLGDSP